jgi:hypothetical protein
MNIKKLISFEKYSKIKHEIPYLYTIKSNNQKLYYFGERHSRDPQDSQWIQAKEFWLEFIKNTANQKRVVFIEGSKPSLRETEEKSIRECGGPGFITFLASQHNVDIYCPEPSKSYETSELLKQFQQEEVAYYYFARSMSGWGRMTEPKPKFEDYITRNLKRNKSEVGWTDFDFSIENMKNIHKNIFEKEFDKNDSDFFKSIVSPIKSETIINKIAKSCSNLRNEYILKEIEKCWNMGNSIYIHYGAGHAVMQEPAIRDLVN